MKHNNTMKLFALFLVSIISASFYAIAVPIGPKTVAQTTQRLDETVWPPWTHEAYAGNVTELIINTWTITRTWQGYYGNITGTIVLADYSNYTLYDWNVASPSGEVYAARTASPTWSTIACANYSLLNETGAEAQFTKTNETDEYGFYPEDAPNMTFQIGGDGGNHPAFSVGSVAIAIDSCPQTTMHNDTGYVLNDQNAGNDPERFHEVVLADDNGNGNPVYVAILEKDWLGFDQRTHDFEMIVPEDGHGTNVATTTYYFWVQLS